MKYVWAAALAVVLACLINPRAAESCGPFLRTMLFTTYHGALPGEFENGRVGVLRPHFYRRDLLLAYRTLSGVRYSPDEAPRPPAASQLTAAESWLAARRAFVTLEPAPGFLPAERRLPNSDYQNFLNCLDDAFVTAAGTLRARAAQWGAASSNLKEWIHGQDQVFRNCSEGSVIPQELVGGDPLLSADRRYQIAAAQFYAGLYDAAEASFDKIAADAKSPWHEIAPYLAARACIRNATILGNKTKSSRAAERLTAILSDPAQTKLHHRAQDMLDLVRARREPEQRLTELGKELMQPNLGPQLERVLTDYTVIWDRIEEKGPKPPSAQSDVADWIVTFQARANAVDKWRVRRTMPWLVAALVSLDGKDPATPELIAAARAVPPASPAFASVAYWGIRRQILAGDAAAARQWADQALAAKPPDAASNLLRAERLKLARDWNEFLRFGPRKPAAVGGIDGEEPASNPEVQRMPAAFDLDATLPFNQHVPLALWIDAATNSLVPRNLQADLAQAGWVRAVLLNDLPAARTLAASLARLKPELAAEMRGYLASQDPPAAHFFAVFLMLRGPGFEPVIRPGFNRDTRVLERDTLRDNWWALGNWTRQPGDDGAHEALFDLYPEGEIGPADFLPKDQRSAGEQQWASLLLERTGNSVNYLASEAIAWAQSHPQDPRVPQALHLVVEATHFGPADGKQSHVFSKQAFDILHRRYPNSEWTKKTKYWY